MAGKKVVLILPPHGVDEEEYRVVRGTLEGRGHPVTTASIWAGSVEAANGSSVPVNIRIHDIKTYEFEGYVFLGGDGVRSMLDNAGARKLVKDVSYKTVAASGAAVALVAVAGGLSKKRVTAPAEWVDLLKRNGAVYTGRPLQVDGRIVTVQESSA
ncbi:MAG: DJ-1/PfpI family protein, partial [Anaerolineae bacterium]